MPPVVKIQYSECHLTLGERQELIAKCCSLIDQDSDRFALLRVQERTKPILRGIAIPPSDPDYYYVG